MLWGCRRIRSYRRNEAGAPVSAITAFGSRLPELVTSPPGPASRAFTDRLRGVESRNVTFVGDGWPLFWEEASGSNVRDADNNTYVDMTSAFGVALLGHSHPAVSAAITKQANLLIHGMGDVHPPTAKLELLERLARLAPWDSAQVVLATTGSEAVEIALKTAQLATGKPGVLAFEGGYHGLTLGSLAVTARADFREPFADRTYGGVSFAPFPEHWREGDRSAEESLASVRDSLRLGAPNGDPIGAVIVEPVQGRGGARLAPDGFMAELSVAAADAGALVIADEIMTGLGRCGAMLAAETVGLVPDLICIGKALGAGMPVAACLGPKSLIDSWPPSEGEALHTSTFLGHPLSCVAASTALDLTMDEGVPKRAAEMGHDLLVSLSQRLSGLPSVGNIRGLGLLLGIELVGPDGITPLLGGAARVASSAMKAGVLVLPAGDLGQVVELAPPVVLKADQEMYALEVLENVIRSFS